MSVSLRDMLVEVWGYSGTVAAGRTQDAYTKLSERWARREEMSGTKTYLNGKEEVRVDGVIAFGDDATDIDPNGVLRVKGETIVYKILGPLRPRRRLREIHVSVAMATAQQYPGVV